MKSETCQGGLYVEMSGCAFDPAKDYSCYKIPTVANAACGAGETPQSSTPCSIDPCVVCNSDGGQAGGGYLDSAGAAKIGYCVCVSSSGGAQKWSCASEISWPCPVGPGC
jgi:hypothetical protein